MNIDEKAVRLYTRRYITSSKVLKYFREVFQRHSFVQINTYNFFIKRRIWRSFFLWISEKKFNNNYFVDHLKTAAFGVRAAARYFLNKYFLAINEPGFLKKKKWDCVWKPKLENWWLEPSSNLQVVTYTKHSHKMGKSLLTLVKQHTGTRR